MSRRKFLRARSLMRPALTPSRVKAYAAGVVGYCTVVVAGLLALVSLSSYAVAQAPLPILRGIVVMPTGEPRAYLEDALTGHLAGYAVRDVVGDSRIVIDNGEAWLEHLGVPPKALSRAIEQAPTKGADNLEDD